MSYPLARAVAFNAENSLPCFHCSRRISVPRWHRFVGVLYECPWCHRFHGKPWGARGYVRAIFLSILGGPFAFFLTARPENAFAYTGIWYLWWTVGAARFEQFTLGIPLFVLIANIVLVVRHDHDLVSQERVYTAIPQ
ncbi:MAG: hypothetical protein M3Q69_02240 [Acidobacteriota bacterium]|nr:hypothetical protein [Acidobacteriota bacterium]